MVVALYLVAYCIGLCHKRTKCHKMQQNTPFNPFPLLCFHHSLCFWLWLGLHTPLWHSQPRPFASREASQTCSFTFGRLQARTLWLHLPKSQDEDRANTTNSSGK